MISNHTKRGLWLALIVLATLVLIAALFSCAKPVDDYFNHTNTVRNIVYLDFDGDSTRIKGGYYYAESAGFATIGKQFEVVDVINELVKRDSLDVFISTDIYLLPDSIKQNIIITESNFNFPGGGWAEIGRWSPLIDAYVFSDRLKHNPKAVAITAYHELLHTLGASHNKEKGNIMYEGLDVFQEEYPTTLPSDLLLVKNKLKK